MLFVCDECLQEVDELPQDGWNGGMVCSDCVGQQDHDDWDDDYDDWDDDYYDWDEDED